MKLQWGALKYMCQYLHFAPRKKRGENVTLVEIVCDEKVMYIFNLFTSFWFPSLGALVQLQITGDDWQIKTVGVKLFCCFLIYFYLFFYLVSLFFRGCGAMPERKLRFQTVQSEFQMRCNSMENIKRQSQFCTLRSEGFLTLHWLAHAHGERRRHWGISPFFSCPFLFLFALWRNVENLPANSS